MKIPWGQLIIAVLAAPFVLTFLSLIAYFIYYTIKGKRIKKRKRYRKPSILKRIIIDFPRQFWLDQFNRDPFEFGEQGLHMFCGEQGSGKTVAVAHMLIELKKRYPDMKIRTNFSFLQQDDELNGWRQMVQNNNGIYGQVEVIDEIQTWFNSMQSKDFPPEMLTEISQQRKQRKMLLGTAQVFGKIAKSIREQTTVVYCPMTILGCITIVRISKPKYYSDEKHVFRKFTGHYFFVHNDEIRNSFDTYKKISGLTKAGFVPKADHYTTETLL